METNKLALKTVKVISQKINPDWIHPYKNKNTSKSIGSGFFIDMEGHILTCAHVIDEAVKIFVEIPNQGDEKIEVEVLGLCPDMDIALLKTKNYKNKDFYQLHEENHIYDIEPGEDAIAIGFPLGQDNIKYTKGIISGRQFGKVQTDTPINPGNSGGPLLLGDKVIGINSSGFMMANNIGYAIPISYFYLLKDELFSKKNKLIRRPFLGLSYQNSNKPLLDINNCKCESGIYVKTVFKGSPIQKCGLKEGDIICSFGGLKVDNFGLLEKEWFNEKMKIDDFLRRIPNNGNIKLEYWRGKKLFKKNFKYSPFELTINTKFPLYETYENKYEVLGGMVISELTVNHLQTIISKLLFTLTKTEHVTKKINNILSYLDTEKRTKSKLIVTHVFPNSYLNNLEIMEDYDIIEKVNGIKCSKIEELRKALLNKKGKYIEIVTELNKKVVLEIPKIIEEESIFAETYKYPISETFKKLKKLGFTKKKSKTKRKVTPSKTKKN
jgi:S1-C subfamily serine protease